LKLDEIQIEDKYQNVKYSEHFGDSFLSVPEEDPVIQKVEY